MAKKSNIAHNFETGTVAVPFLPGFVPHAIKALDEAIAKAETKEPLAIIREVIGSAYVDFLRGPK